MTYEIKGTVKEIGEVQTFPSGFTKRDLVVDTASKESKYPNPVKLSFTKERCSKLDSLSVGSEVTVKFGINGRRWDGPKGVQYFVDLAGIEVSSDHGGTGSVTPPPAKPEGGSLEDAGDGEMPF